MAHTPMVSIVVPAFNAEKYLDQAIESVIAQSFDDWELLIVDDGSSDHTLTIAQKHVQMDSRIHLFQHENGKNKGVSKSRRLALNNARGAFIAFLDADDLFEPDKLKKQLALAALHPECVLFHSGITIVDQHDKELPDSPFQKNANELANHTLVYRLLDRKNFLQGNQIVNSSTLVRTAALRKLNFGFHQLFQFEDWTMWVLLAEHGPFCVQSERLSRYRQHSDNYTSEMRQTPLKEVYAFIELALSIRAMSSDHNVRTKTDQILAQKLTKALNLYRQSSGRGSIAGVFHVKYSPPPLSQQLRQSDHITIRMMKFLLRPFKEFLSSKKHKKKASARR